MNGGAVFLSVTSNYLKTCFNPDKTSVRSLIATSTFLKDLGSLLRRSIVFIEKMCHFVYLGSVGAT